MSLRPLTSADLPQLERWLREPHVARWYLQDSTIEQELAGFRDAIDGVDPTVVQVVVLDGGDVGWCQWYRWWAYPPDAEHYGADEGSVGFDYALGDPAVVGQGVGTELIALLVVTMRAAYPGATIVVGPSAANAASCRVLAKSGFQLVGVRDIPGEPNASPIAIYRLAAAPA